MNPERPFRPEEFAEGKPENKNEPEKPAPSAPPEKKGLSRRAFLKGAGGLAAAAAGGYVAHELWESRQEAIEASHQYDLLGKKYTREDLLSGKASAEEVLKNFGLFAGKPWAKELAKIAGLKNIKLFFQVASEVFRHLPKAEIEEVVSDLALEAPNIVFENFPAYAQALSDETRFLQKLLDQRINPELIVANANFFRKLPEAEKIFREAAEDAQSTSNFEAFLKNPQGYNLYPEAQKYLENAARAASEDRHGSSVLLEYASKLRDQKWAGELITKAVRLQPDIAIQTMQEWSFIPETQKLQKQTFASCLEGLKRGQLESASAMMFAYENYRDDPEAKLILRKSLETLLEKDSSAYSLESRVIVSKLQAIIATEPWVMDYILRGIQQGLRAGNDNMPLQAYLLYKDLPQAERIVRQTAESTLKTKDYFTILGHAEKFLPYEWGKKMVLEAAEKDLQFVLQFSQKIRDLPAFKGIMEKYLQTGVGRERALEYSFIFEEDWAFPYLKQAVAENPSKFLQAIRRRHLMAKKFIPLINEAAEYAGADDVLASGNFLLGIDKKWAREKLKQTTDANSSSTLANANYFDRLPNHQEIILKAAQESARLNPFTALQHFRAYYRLPDGAEIARAALRRASREAENAHRDFFELLPKLAFLGEDELRQAGELAIPNDFVAFALRLLGGSRREKEFYARNFASSPNPEIRRVFEICTSEKLRRLVDENTETALLIGLNNPGMSEAELVAIVSDQGTMITHLAELKNRPELKYEYGLERALENRCLRIVRRLNQLHDSPPQKRFASVEGLKAEVLYYLMTYGEQEVFTSTFNGLFDRLKGRLASQKTSGFELLEQVKHDQFRSFVKLCAQYGRLGEFLGMMSASDQEKVLQNFVSGLEEQKDFEAQAVAVADTFATVTDETVLRLLQEKLKQEYDRVRKEGKPRGEALYGLLAGMFGRKAVINEQWIQDMAKKYKLPELLELKADRLFNPDGSNIQEHCFYNDEDGKASFASFINQYMKSPDWKFADHGNYVSITSVGGRRVEIYANKPEFEDQGPKDIERVLANRKLESIVVVHRGHSYHADKTIRRIPKIAKIVSLGSCGGYNNIDAVLQRAPEAHIISTKSTGTMKVNDPILKMLNEEIRAGRNLHWPSFWQKAEKNFGRTPEFLGYIPPHKNLGVLFLKAYRQQTREAQ